MKFERASGVLLHPTSLPGPYGIGEIGPEADRFADHIVHGGPAPSLSAAPTQVQR